MNQDPKDKIPAEAKRLLIDTVDQTWRMVDWRDRSEENYPKRRIAATVNAFGILSFGVNWNELIKLEDEFARRYLQSVKASPLHPFSVERLSDVLAQIASQKTHNLDAPKSWYLQSLHIPLVKPVGKNLLLTNAALESKYLGAIVAHGLMRVHNGDGAIRVILDHCPEQGPRENNYDQWRDYWREKVFEADKFVVDCGYTKEMIEYLEFLRPLEGNISYTEQEPLIHERLNQLKRLGA